MTESRTVLCVLTRKIARVMFANNAFPYPLVDDDT